MGLGFVRRLLPTKKRVQLLKRRFGQRQEQSQIEAKDTFSVQTEKYFDRLEGLTAYRERSTGTQKASFLLIHSVTRYNSSISAHEQFNKFILGL